SLRPKSPFARLTLASGDRVSLAKAICKDGKNVKGTTLFKADVEYSLSQIVALSIYQSAAIYVSDVKPRKYEYIPFGSVQWQLAKDSSVAGDDLCMAGNTFDKGIGLHSESRVTYDCGGKYRRFEALVGLDEKTGRKGSVRVSVQVDGKTRDLGLKEDLTGF